MLAAARRKSTGTWLCIRHLRRWQRTGELGPVGKLPQHGEVVARYGKDC